MVGMRFQVTPLTIAREVAIATVVAWATLQLFDLLFPFLVNDIVQDYRALSVLAAILVGWVLVEGWYSSQDPEKA